MGLAAQPTDALPGLAPSSPTKAGEVKCEHVTAKAFREFSEQVWRLPAWDRGKPPHKVIQAQRAKLRCMAGPGHRKAAKARWKADKDAFYKHRRTQLWRVRVTPFYGCTSARCGFWSIPAYIVECESGGRYNDPSAPNGAYSMLTGPLQGVPTWESWRPDWAAGYAAPYQAPPKAQDIAAHRLWVAYGSSPWTCA